MKQSVKSLLNKYVSENSKIFKTDGKVLFCKVCKKSVTFQKKSSVDQHLRTQKHIDKYAEMIGIGNTSTRVYPLDTNFLNKYVSENKEIFETDGEVLFCKVCKKSVSCHKKFLVYQHLRSQKHKSKYAESFKKKSQISRNKLSTVELLKKYVSENSEVFETDGEVLLCKLCNKLVSFEKKFCVDQHLRTQKHKDKCAERTVGGALQDGSGVHLPEGKQSLFTEKLNEVGQRYVSFQIKNSEISRVKLSTVVLLNKYVSENSEIFETDGKVLLCKVCNKSVSFDKKFCVDQHLRTQKHKDKCAQRTGRALQAVSSGHLSEGKQSPFTKKLNEEMQEMCRTCMKQLSQKEGGEKQSITEIPTGGRNSLSIMKLLQFVQPHIKIDTKDDLPSNVCSDCIQKLLVSHEFIEMYQNVDKKLRKMLEEFDVDKYNNSKEQNEFQEDINESIDFEETKYEIEIEQVNIDSMGKEKEDDNEWQEIEDEPLKDISDDAENDDSALINPYSDASDDDWIPNQSWLNESLKKYKWDDETENSASEEEEEKKEVTRAKENEDNVSLLCQQCGTDFDHIKLWREHMRENHGENKPKRTYTKRSNEPRKKRIPSVQKKNASSQDGFKCEHCGKKYSKYSSYRIHMRIHKVEPFLCIECGKSFQRVSSLNTHMLRHKGEKSYQCPHCPKNFVCSSGLYGHMMVHTDKKPYVCDICGSAFHMAYQLRHHNLYHAGIKKFKCEYCEMKFVTREKQRRHMRTHTGEKPYRCKYCERAFAQSNDCVKHLRQHLGDNVYQCELCPLRFPLARDLRVHFATHKDDDEETRARNLEARLEEEQNLQIKLGSKEVV